MTTSARRFGGWRELALIVAGYGALTAFLMAPMAFHLGSVGRIDNADARLLIWNVAWVARTLIVDPLHVFDANIFYPHRGTLAYSESNLGAGILAIPVYWATRNPYAAHNFVLLLSFVLSGTGTYYLVRYLVRDRRAAVVAGICFAYCPYVFSHLPHIHLLMTAGLPFSMLAFHRVADRPTWARGAVLGLAIAGQALFCGYYAVFVGLTVGFAVLVVATTRGLWADRHYWTAISVAVGVAMVTALPLFLPYVRVQRETGFHRSPNDARALSADWRTYFASSAHAHRWMLAIIRQWNEVLFPGFIALFGGVAGAVTGWRGRGHWREVAVVYGGLAAVAFWASLGPDVGLYRVLSVSIPAFSLMRAPSRFGLIVTFALSVLAGLGVAAVLARLSAVSRPQQHGSLPPVASSRAAWVVAIAFIIAAPLELKVPVGFSAVPPLDPAYRILATLPSGPVIELPFYSTRSASMRTHYMLSSTAHWMPLVNAYSSYIPGELIENTDALVRFPTIEALHILERDRVRYAVFHLERFSPEERDDLVQRLRELNAYLVRRYADDRVWLYEIVRFPH